MFFCPGRMTRFLPCLPWVAGCLLWMTVEASRPAEAPNPVLPAGKESSGPKVGGFTPASATERGVKAAATFAILAHQKALREKPASQAGSGSQTPPAPRLELVRILGAEQQVVAGLNYRLQLRVTLDGEEKTAEALVWWQAWRKPEPYQLTSWTWK